MAKWTGILRLTKLSTWNLFLFCVCDFVDSVTEPIHIWINTLTATPLIFTDRVTQKLTFYIALWVFMIIFVTIVLNITHTENQLSCKNYEVCASITFTTDVTEVFGPLQIKLCEYQPFQYVLPGWCQREFQRVGPAWWCHSLTSHSQEVQWSTACSSIGDIGLKCKKILITDIVLVETNVQTFSCNEADHVQFMLTSLHSVTIFDMDLYSCTSSEGFWSASPPAAVTWGRVKVQAEQLLVYIQQHKQVYMYMIQTKSSGM